MEVDHTTIYRWVQFYAPKMEKKIKRHFLQNFSDSWRVDETYIKVKGVYKYLYRAVDKQGNTIDFYLSHTRNAKAAKRFLTKCLNRICSNQKLRKINTDLNPAYTKALKEIKEQNPKFRELLHTQVKYLNNIVESDHGKLKRLVKPTLGFKSMKTAYATIKGFETMRMFHKNQFNNSFLNLKSKIDFEIRTVQSIFS